MTHHLYCGPTYIGRIEDIVEDQSTLFGHFELETNRETDNEIDRVLVFIDFCREWSNQQKTSSPPDASEFGQFADLIGDGIWTMINESGNQVSIADAPMFYGGRCGELSWVVALHEDPNACKPTLAASATSRRPRQKP